MTPRAEIVRASAADAEELAAVEAASFAVPWSARELAQTLASPFALALRAVRAGECVGYLCATALLGEAEVLRVAVLPTARRQGIARALLRTFAENVPANVIFLEVRASNTAARALYASEGFSETGRRKNYYEKPAEDAVCMRLDRQKVTECGF